MQRIESRMGKSGGGEGVKEVKVLRRCMWEVGLRQGSLKDEGNAVLRHCRSD